MNHARLLKRILKGYLLPPWGFHGVGHWARVADIGLKLAQANGADVDIVMLFALFHDSRRVNDGPDEDHGLRGAELAQKLRGRYFELPNEKFDLLYRACELHTVGRGDPDLTVRTCWDSDRLDLGRVGIMPEPKYLGTPEARDPKMIRWAYARSVREALPDWMNELWGTSPEVGEVGNADPQSSQSV
jgi:uncharacterized protein